MAVSRSSKGLAAPLLLVATRTERLLALPLYVLDISSNIHLEPSWFVSHRHRLAGVESIEVRPVRKCESCIHVHVNGSDGYRIMLRPSGAFDALPKSFPRTLLVVVLLALLIAVILTRRMTRSSRLNAIWYGA